MRTDVDDVDNTSLIIGMALAFVFAAGWELLSYQAFRAFLWLLCASMCTAAAYKSYRNDVQEVTES